MQGPNIRSHGRLTRKVRMASPMLDSLFISEKALIITAEEAELTQDQSGHEKSKEKSPPLRRPESDPGHSASSQATCCFELYGPKKKKKKKKMHGAKF